MTLSLPIAFLAGILSFLSPCVLPLVPTYLLYLGGQRGRPLRNAVFFVLGFSAIFFLLGLPFTLLGSLLFEYRDLLGRVGGVVLILLGLYMLGLRPKWGVNLRYEGPTDRPWGAFVLGIVLGLGWTPCIGPILGGILTLTATGEGGAPAGGLHPGVGGALPAGGPLCRQGPGLPEAGGPFLPCGGDSGGGGTDWGGAVAAHRHLHPAQQLLPEDYAGVVAGAVVRRWNRPGTATHPPVALPVRSG